MSELLGKRVLIDITCLGPDGRQVDRFTTEGTVEAIGHDRIGVRRAGLAELFGLPPAPELFKPADAETLEGLAAPTEDPDYVVSLTVNCPDADTLLTIRGMGYEP